MTAIPTVTILDPLSWDHGWSYQVEQELLAARGVRLVVPADRAERDIQVRLADVIVVSGLDGVDADLIATFERCRGIVCYSAGLDAVDVNAAHQAGISVTGIHANTIDVAEHAFALLLAIRRRIVPMTRAAEEGRWHLATLPEVWEIPRLAGGTLGIVGAGRIGRAVARRARAFDVTTIANYHRPPTDPDPLLPSVSLHDLMSSSDSIVVCASLTPDSRQLIDAAALAVVKPGAVLVNVGRGAIIDEAALIDALDDGRLAGVALDVRDPEPPRSDDPLRSRDDVIQTPHMAGASRAVLDEVHLAVTDEILRVLDEGGLLPTSPGD